MKRRYLGIHQQRYVRRSTQIKHLHTEMPQIYRYQNQIRLHLRRCTRGMYMETYTETLQGHTHMVQHVCTINTRTHTGWGWGWAEFSPSPLHSRRLGVERSRVDERNVCREVHGGHRGRERRLCGGGGGYVWGLSGWGGNTRLLRSGAKQLKINKCVAEMAWLTINSGSRPAGRVNFSQDVNHTHYAASIRARLVARRL